MSLHARGLQPWGRRLFRGVWKSQKPFLCKTVLVKDNDVDQAYRQLTKYMAREGLIDLIRRTQRFEKPTLQRARRNYEICRAVYDEEMKRKIQFISRKNRRDPFPGHY